jgi:hypothetical protein
MSSKSPVVGEHGVFGAILVAVSGLVVIVLLAGVELPDSFGLLTANYAAVPALAIHPRHDREME